MGRGIRPASAVPNISRRQVPNTDHLPVLHRGRTRTRIHSAARARVKATTWACIESTARTCIQAAARARIEPSTGSAVTRTTRPGIALARCVVRVRRVKNRRLRKNGSAGAQREKQYHFRPRLCHSAPVDPIVLQMCFRSRRAVRRDRWNACKGLVLLVGVTGFEPATPTSRMKSCDSQVVIRADKL